MEKEFIKIPYNIENDDISGWLDCDDWEYIKENGEEYIYVGKDDWDKACKEQEEYTKYCAEQERETKKRTEYQKYIDKYTEALKNNDIDGQIVYLEKAINVGVRIKVPYYDLAMIYKKLNRNEDELRVNELCLNLFPNDLRLKKRIKQLKGILPQESKPESRMKVQIHDKTWGEKFFEKWDSLTKDDFYLETDEFYDWEDGIQRKRLYLKEEKKQEIDAMIKYLYENEDVKKAEIAEADNDYVTAIKFYEKIASEEIPYTDYYGHIAIYRKFRLREAELESILEMIEMVKKNEERYEILKRRFADWFPDSEFSEMIKEGYRNPSIGFISFPPCRLSIYANTLKRVPWLRDKLSKKNN